jgi:hypothetical protein
VAGRVGDHGGGIAGLSALLGEFGEAIRYDLLTVGLRLDDLGTSDLSWTDLKAVIVHSPPGSAFQRARHGEYATWTAETHLLAVIADALRIGNWQRTGSKRGRPKPIPRPTDKAVKRLTTAELRKNEMQSGVIGAPIPLDELKRRVRAKNAR